MSKIAVVLVGLGIVVGGCGNGDSEPLPDWEYKEAAAKEFECSDLTRERWEELRAKKSPPLALTGFAIKLQECETLVGMSRKDLYAFLGVPERSGQSWPNRPKLKYASWVVGYDRMFGDELALTTAIVRDKVKSVGSV